MFFLIRLLLLVFGLIPILVVTPGCRKDYKEVLAEMRSKGTVLEADGIETFYREMGSGPDMILVHGFGSSTVTWERVMPGLAESYHVCALDIVGFGLSEKPKDPGRYTYDSFARQLIGFMDAKGMKSAILVGNSMGGAIVLRCAVGHPERVNKLILVDSGGYPLKTPITLALIRMPILGDFLQLFNGEWIVRANLKDAYYDETLVKDDWVRYYTAPMVTENGLDAPQDFLRSESHRKPELFVDRIKEISVPTLIIWGEQDSWIPLENSHRFHQDILNSHLVVIPNCGHLPQEEKPLETARAILEFAGATRQGMNE